MSELTTCEHCKDLIPDDDYYSDDSGFYHGHCIEILHRQGALDACVPIEVVNGTKELSDFFSQAYIDFKTNRNQGAGSED